MSLGYTFNGSPSIRMRLNSVCDALDGLATELAIVEAKIDEIKEQGVIQATIHWRRKPTDDKPGILELLHPQESDYAQANGRRREYIGVDPDRQAIALAAVRRWKTLLDAVSEYNRIKGKMTDIKRQITRLELTAQGKQRVLPW